MRDELERLVRFLGGLGRLRENGLRRSLGERAFFDLDEDFEP